MLRILHVEDDRTYLATLRTALAGKVMLEQVETLAAARERLADTTAPTFDVLLVDLRLPDAHDMEAVIALRVYGIPLVVLSATSLPESLERAAEAGAEDYLVKGPVDADLIMRRVRFVCKRFRQVIETNRPKRRTLDPHVFEMLKPFITCGSATICG